VQKIILFYKFVPLSDPIMTMRWQKELCENINLRGRVIISKDGINGTLGGELSDLKKYVSKMNRTAEFKKIEYKWSKGSREDFPKLSVKVRQELVTLDPDEQFNPFNSGTALNPAAWHDYVEKHPEVTIIDARNTYESNIGAFKGAIKPDIKTFKQIKKVIEKLPKEKPILTYCTGDVRCEYLSAYMKHKGFKDVYHLEGGIIKYGEKYGHDGTWEGKCYVFDRRMSIAFSERSVDIGKCVHCGENTSLQSNCADSSCNLLFVVCKNCQLKRQTNCDLHRPVNI
jgi:UPF0176 protein